MGDLLANSLAAGRPPAEVHDHKRKAVGRNHGPAEVDTQSSAEDIHRRMVVVDNHTAGRAVGKSHNDACSRRRNADRVDHGQTVLEVHRCDDAKNDNNIRSERTPRRTGCDQDWVVDVHKSVAGGQRRRGL
eukprot:CAMPEP_0117570080 /NCGR_PEP_ID=MMETSP0784-20121206/59005_1 /TAXON_ID=39447 /ORGANISM="" /LENGTH=130 /DNA_ID=CAMNT_0005368105 /DNA_START=393 /DNA_END=785 /DNA_ORIENTATION=-